MKKTVPLFLITLIVVFFYSCVGKVDNIIKIEQLSSKHPVVISNSEYGSSIYELKLFLEYAMRKKILFGKVNLSMPGDYHVKTKNWDGSIISYQINNGTLEIEENIPLSIFRNEEIILCATFFIDSMSLYNKFEADMTRLISSNIDTIHIGTIAELMQSDKQFLTEFIQVDSIRFSIYYNDLYYPVSIPVELK